MDFFQKVLLKEESMNFQENDVYRYDLDLKMQLLSITFPNYKMFYSIRTQDTSKNWAVLVIDAYSVLSKNVHLIIQMQQIIY